MAGQADNGHAAWLAELSANLTQEKADVFKQQLGSCLAAAGMLPSSLWPKAGTMDDGSEGALRALLGKLGPPANFRKYDSGAAHGKDTVALWISKYGMSIIDDVTAAARARIPCVAAYADTRVKGMSPSDEGIRAALADDICTAWQTAIGNGYAAQADALVKADTFWGKLLRRACDFYETEMRLNAVEKGPRETLFTWLKVHGTIAVDATIRRQLLAGLPVQEWDAQAPRQAAPTDAATSLCGGDRGAGSQNLSQDRDHMVPAEISSDANVTTSDTQKAESEIVGLASSELQTTPQPHQTLSALPDSMIGR